MVFPRAFLLASVVSTALLLHGCGGSGKPTPAPSGATCSGLTTAEDVAAGMDLTGKVAIVTGGDGGLGFPVVRALAQRGAMVVIASRKLSKCEAIANKVKAETGSDVRGMRLDLASFASIRAFVKQFLGNSSRLDIIINNAGIANNPPFKSKDGFQMLFAVNYLGPFLLTELLLPVLRSSGSANSPSRVVNVASSEHRIACEAAGWAKGCLKDWTYFPPPELKEKNVTIHYDDGLVVTRPIELYGFTKMLSIEHVLELSRREGPTVKAFSLTPGWVNDTLGVYKGINPIAVKEKCNLQRPDPCPYKAEQGAAITVFCALRSTVSGGYYSRIKHCSEDVVESNGFRDSMGPELYNRSLHLAGESFTV